MKRVVVLAQNLISEILLPVDIFIKASESTQAMMAISISRNGLQNNFQGAKVPRGLRRPGFRAAGSRLKFFFFNLLAAD